MRKIYSLVAVATVLALSGCGGCLNDHTCANHGGRGGTYGSGKSEHEFCRDGFRV